MSFLSGLKKVGSWITGSSFSANLAKTAIIGYTIYRLNRNLNKANDPQQTIDEGVRLQLNPSAENKVPVVYGAAFLSGIITDAEMTGDNKTMFFCLAISEKTGSLYSTGAASTTAFREVFWNDQKITFKSDGVTVDFTQDRQGIIDRSLEGRVRVYCYDGNSATQRAVDNFSLATSVNAANLIPNWSPSTHQMNDLVFAVVRVDYDRDRGVTSLGNVKFHIENTMTKPGDCLYDYFTNSIYGAGVPLSELDVTTLTALNNFSDQNVVYEDQELGPNQVLAARYRINGVVDTEDSVLDNVELLASAAGSWISYDVQKGQWGVVINKEESAIVNFDDSTVIGSISISGTGIEDLYNRVKVEFPNRDIRDAADFITIALPPEDVNANEYENTLNIAYNIINEPVQAEILGFIELKQSRVDLVIRFTTDYSYTTLTAGDVVNVTNSRIGWTNKPFRVVAINERQDDSGQLLVDVTALEYDADVYSVLDLFRFTRSDQNGIITIGSIGVPGTPVVTKIEQASRPRIIVNSNSPTGIVERMEFWRTTDVSVPEAQRNYTLIGTVNPVGGGTFGINQQVTFEYDSQGAGNFLIKTRGLNSITTGPFSEPSGIIEFVPQQVPDTIGPNTSLSGIIGALGALELLNLIDRLMKNEAGEGGLFDKIFSIFRDETGVDIVGDAKDGALVVESDISLSKDGSSITENLAGINFTGNGVGEITVDNDKVTINIPGLQAGGALPPGNENKDILAWNDAAQEWQLISGCITCDFPPEPPPPVDPDRPDPNACYLTLSQRLPLDRPTWREKDQLFSPSQVPFTGAYYLKFAPQAGTLLLSPLSIGTGTARLYESNGTLVQTINASSAVINVDVVTLNFSNRKPGTDYYILIDPGFVTYCGCQSPGITNARDWNFVTAPYEVDAFAPLTPSTIVIPTLPDFDFNISPSQLNSCINRNIEFTFNESVSVVSGNFTIVNNQTNATVASIALSSGTFSDGNKKLTFGSLTSYGLQRTTQYRIEIDRGLLRTTRTTCDLPTGLVPQQENLAKTVNFSIIAPLVITSFRLFSDPFTLQGAQFDPNKVNIRSNIKIFFNRNIQVGSSASPDVDLYLNGQIIQKFRLSHTFQGQFVSDTFLIEGNQLVLNPTDIMVPGGNYYVIITPNAISDVGCEEQFPGTNSTQIVWKTDEIVIDPIAPLAANQTLRDQPLELNFDRPVVPGTGAIKVFDNQGALVATIPNTDPAVSYEA